MKTSGVSVATMISSISPIRHTGIRERALGGGCSKVDSRLILGRHPPSLDPGAGRNPLVGGVYMLCPIVVGHHPIRHVGAEAEHTDPFLGHVGLPSGADKFTRSPENSLEQGLHWPFVALHHQHRGGRVSGDLLWDLADQDLAEERLLGRADHHQVEVAARLCEAAGH